MARKEQLEKELRDVKFVIERQSSNVDRMEELKEENEKLKEEIDDLKAKVAQKGAAGNAVKVKEPRIFNSLKSGKE